MPRPQSQDLDLGNAPGVSLPKIKALETLGYKFIDIRDKKAKLAEDLGAVETKMLELMAEKGIERYRFGDQELLLKKGKNHAKVRTIKVEPGEEQEDEDSSARSA
jgi:hypothetical protein